MSDALSYSTYAPSDSLRTAVSSAGAAIPIARPLPLAPRPIGNQLLRIAPLPAPAPVKPALPRSTAERMVIARDRIRAAAESGERVRSYEVALDVDMSEFHFARQFRLAFGRSPHVFYDEIRAERARELLGQGVGEGEVARRIGFRRPAELRALLAKR